MNGADGPSIAQSNANRMCATLGLAGGAAAGCWPAGGGAGNVAQAETAAATATDKANFLITINLLFEIWEL
jgi:hypothetical protein